jgi:hypothetical protein
MHDLPGGTRINHCALGGQEYGDPKLPFLQKPGPYEPVRNWTAGRLLRM